jgi:two-component system, OmpR family, phosphate regulon response regulator OmpR
MLSAEVIQAMTTPPTLSTHRPAARKLLDDHSPHVLVVDDDTRIRTLLQRYLSSEGYRVTTAESAEAARAKLSSIAFDGLILDVMMPGENGFDLARELKKSLDTPILMLTARAEAEDRVMGLEIGADDYLPKPFDPRELLLRLTNMLKHAAAKPGSEAIEPDMVRFGPFTFNIARGELVREGELVRITDREREMLTALARANGAPVAREALAGAAAASMAGDRSVDVQINRLRRKIEADVTNPRWLMTARGQGYRLAVEP